ncbi:MAG TPA: HAMP domain-containing sensor histidine kinase [Candidatus Limnocylindria bacterium]|nr:HAMP domain-containing sensor histidine kinase [Candidatus Limnocylindria bacterium]
MSRRISFLLLAAILLPALIVAALGWVSLRQWEASADILFREQARDMASMAAEKIEMVLRSAEDAFLDDLQAVLDTAGVDDAALHGLLARAPLVRRLYLFDGGGRLLAPMAGHDPAELGVARALAVRLAVERGGRRHAVAGDEGALAFTVKARDGAPLVAVFWCEEGALRREVFGRVLSGLESATVLAVVDDRGRTVYSRTPVEAAVPVMSVPVRDGVRNWRVAVYQTPGSAPRQALRRQVMMFMTAFALLLAVIAAGSVATWRLMRRESEMARLKADFVANVSHDLKTPLSVIRMFGETLEMGRVAEARRQEYYRVITRESERLSRLIDNVLDFSRIESGRRRYDPAPTAVEPLVRDTLASFAYPLAQRGFKVEVTIDPGIGDVVMDAEAVGQALANLVDNAMKYSADDRALAIEARREGERLALAVTDRGIGIPAGEHARVFDKFYRVGRSDTQGRRGSGVGLALVRHVAEAHGGTVTLDSAPGRGSTFTLWLPAPRRHDA